MTNVPVLEKDPFEPNERHSYVLYHNDLDGCASSWVASLHPDWENARFIPVQYGSEFPQELIYPESNILIVDFSYDRVILEKVQPQVQSLMVIDHHETAQEDLKGLDYCVYDNSECGATLTWKTLHPHLPEIPQILGLVKDWDLFSLKDPRTLAFKIGIGKFGQMHNHRFWDSIGSTWHHFEKQEAHPAWDFYEKGKVLADELSRQFHRMVSGGFYRKIRLTDVLKEFMCEGDLRDFFPSDIDLSVAFYHEAENISLKAKHINNNDKTIDATISYFQAADGQIVFNMRSPDRTEKAHLGRLARTIRHACHTNSGGGHRHSAGIALPAAQGVRLLSIFMLK